MMCIYNKVALGVLWISIALYTSAFPIDIKVDYSRHKVVRVHPRDEGDLALLDHLDSQPLYGIDFWNEPSVNRSVDFHISPDKFDAVIAKIVAAGITYDLLIDNVQELIDHENDALEGEEEDEEAEEEDVTGSRFRRSINTTSSTGSRGEDDIILQYFRNIVSRYARHSEINHWLEFWLYFRPEIVRVFDIGYSYEGRSLRMIKIGNGRPGKPAIWIDGGIHAREWISPTTAVYFIYALLEGYGHDRDITRLVDTFDWYILPVINPDGYEYSHSTDRMWRKTRSRTASATCRGVDANRNFDYQWIGHCETNYLHRCLSLDPCHNTFAGGWPFSEPETIAVANFLLRERIHIKMYISLHSYSQLWLTPWGHTRQTPEDFHDLMRVASTATQALWARHGTQFVAGSPAVIIYAAGGASFDWAKGVAGIKYSFTVELRDKGRYGFILPRRFIIPVGEETFEAVKAAAFAVLEELD